MTQLRTANELRAVDEPAWDEVRGLIAGAAVSVRVLDAPEERRAQALEALQMTTRSFLGAMASECGAILLDNGWLRLFGAGADGVPGIDQINGLAGGPPASFIAIGFDVLGGRFAINGGGLPAEPGEVCYWGPDTLSWAGLGPKHGPFLEGMFGGALASFYEDLRWPGWEAEVAALAPDQGISAYPPPFTVEGKDLGAASRRPVPFVELYDFYNEAARQLG